MTESALQYQKNTVDKIKNGDHVSVGLDYGGILHGEVINMGAGEYPDWPSRYMIECALDYDRSKTWNIIITLGAAFKDVTEFQLLLTPLPDGTWYENVVIKYSKQGSPMNMEGSTTIEQISWRR